MAKAIKTASNHGEIDAAKLREQIGSMLAAEGAAAVLKVEAAILMCEGVRDGIFKGDNAAIGIEVYGLSKAPNTTDEERKTFKSQASKLSAVVKAYRLWNDPKVSLRVLDDAASITNKGWNKFVPLCREIARNFKDKAAPSRDQILELTVAEDAPEKTLADYAAAAVKALDVLAEKTGNGKVITALETVTTFAETLGKTSAELKAEQKKAKTGLARIAELREKAKNVVPAGATVN